MKQQISSEEETKNNGVFRGKFRLFGTGLGAYFAVVLTSLWLLIFLEFFIIDKHAENKVLFPYTIISVIYLVGYSIVTTRLVFGSTSYKVRQLIKRFFDIVISALGLFLILPVLIVISIAIELDSPGPILYCSKRVGQFGRIFDSYTFRTTKFPPSIIIETRTGRFLRRFSLDQLPLLYNVLEGEMSLIGPCPRRSQDFMATIDPEKRILRLKPGMTGLWQVSRSPSSEAINYDLEYIERWSLFLDIKIMLKTIIGVLFNN